MPALIRDAPAGVVLRLVFGAKAFPYNDEKPGFQPPRSKAPSEKAVVEDVESSDNATKTDGEKPDSASSGSDEVQVVEWYGADDPDNPQNWSTAKKSFVLFLICLLTFAVYSGSAIVTPAQPAFVEMFGVSKQVSSLTLSLYVLGYGLGPLLFSPLSEVPRLGRNIPYMVSLTLFILITVAAARVDNYPGFVVLRFLQGFLGGPVLATGGASAGDVLGFHKIPYGLTVWLCAAYAGPALGPLLSAYAVTGSSWRWTMYELLILCGSVFLVCLFALPETNADTILLHRARRLRKQTGNLKLQSQSEVKQGNMHLFEVMARHLTTPFRITVQDPSIAFINIYTALFYGIYYSYFESFPLVYMGIYHFSIGTMGIVFLSIIIACALAALTYILLLWYIYEPYTVANGIGVQEHRLFPGIFASIVGPAGIFIFGWTAREDIHWVVPTVGVVLYSSSVFILASVIFIYLPTTYPKYAASLFAGNAFFRSVLACGAVHFSQPLFEDLGVGPGCSVLGGLSALCVLGVVWLYLHGAKLRAKSKFAGF